MKLFDIDYQRLIRLLLIIMLRKPGILILLGSLLSPVSSLYNRFLINRNSNLYRLSITPQVCFLEKLLNDRFDSGSRRIYIEDGVFYENIYLYTDQEDVDVYIFTENENNNNYIYTSSESGSESVDFIVNVPASLQFNVAEFTTLLNTYKLVSKTYTINRI